MLPTNLINLRLALHCKKAYGRTSPIQPDYTLNFTNDSVIITYDQQLEALVIAIRGSDKEWKDWRSNFRFISKKTPYGKCHRGFYNSAKKMLASLENIIKLYKDVSKVYITGHSRGGAIGVALSELLSMEVTLVTFGSPRVFKKDSKLTTKTTRVFHEDDIVTKNPWEWLGFRHYGSGLELPGGEHDLDEYTIDL